MLNRGMELLWTRICSIHGQLQCTTATLSFIGICGKLEVGASGILQPLSRGLRIKFSGETCSYHNNDLIIMKYNDRKVVYLLSTVLRCVKVPTGKVDVDPRNGERILKPEVVTNYDMALIGLPGH